MTEAYVFQEALTMEYLVTMTTHVPEGISEGAVEEIRTREAARSGQLATEGHLLRLWRPPLQPGEWRTPGPVRGRRDTSSRKSWPRCPCGCGAPMRSPRSRLTRMTRPTDRRPRTPARIRGHRVPDHVHRRRRPRPLRTVMPHRGQADRARELAGQGYLERLWTLPGQDGVLGLWRAPDRGQMDAILASLPLSPWMSVADNAAHPTPQ